MKLKSGKRSPVSRQSLQTTGWLSIILSMAINFLQPNQYFKITDDELLNLNFFYP